MACILFTCELGGALGHLANVRVLAERLHRCGHEIHVATNDPYVATQVMRGLPARLHAAPTWRQRRILPVEHVRTYAHVLHNIGYDEPQTLTQQLSQWQTLLARIKPRIVVCDASPTVLLACRGTDIPTVVVGTGFDVPPRLYPLPELTFWDPGNSKQLKQDEDAILLTTNRALEAVGNDPLATLSDIFAAKMTIITTVRELDHYPLRESDDYVGPIAEMFGEIPRWPDAATHRILAYLKPFPELPRLLQYLQRREVPSIIYGPSLPPRIAMRFRNSFLYFANNPVDIAQASQSATLAITNGGHGLSLQMLLAGVPLLLFPLVLEQQVLARTVDAMGVGKYCSPWRSDRIETAVDSMLDDSLCSKHAAAFAARHKPFRSIDHATRLTQQIDELTR
jgi:UDP-N-acetylglucosamine:LPS N-acetylglucosamine transferase